MFLVHSGERPKALVSREGDCKLLKVKDKFFWFRDLAVS
jgi:hypothetical protein